MEKHLCQMPECLLIVLRSVKCPFPSVTKGVILSRPVQCTRLKEKATNSVWILSTH